MPWIEELWNAEPGSPDEQELDALATLVDAYERKNLPVLPLDPIAAIRARCEQIGWTRKDLEALIGTRARVSEVLAGNRALTLPMIRKLHAAMHIPAEVLIGAAPPNRSGPKRANRPVVRRKGSKRAA